MQSGGANYSVELGRLDGLSSTAASVEGNLPGPTMKLNQLNSMFSKHGLTQADMIALSGTISLFLLYNLVKNMINEVKSLGQTE